MAINSLSLIHFDTYLGSTYLLLEFELKNATIFLSPFLTIVVECNVVCLFSLKIWGDNKKLKASKFVDEKKKLHNQFRHQVGTTLAAILDVRYDVRTLLYWKRLVPGLWSNAKCHVVTTKKLFRGTKVMISRIELKKYNSAKRLLFIKAYLFSSHGMHVGEWDYVKEARRPSFKWHKELQRL